MPRSNPNRSAPRWARLAWRSRLIGAASAPFLVAALLGGTAEAAAPDEVSGPAVVTVSAAPEDPFQSLNRRSFEAADAVDRAIVRPAAVAYRHAAPRPVREGIARFGANLDEPAVFVNDALQARPRAAARTLARFVVNSTLGVGGLFDVAARAGLARHENDFGLTLARWGVGSGPYLFLPLVGPSSVRDASAKIVTLALNPLTYVGFAGSGALSVGQGAANGLERRGAADGELKALRASTVDTYAAVRSYYIQARRAEIRGGAVDVVDLPDFSDPAGDAPASGGGAQ